MIKRYGAAWALMLVGLAIAVAGISFLMEARGNGALVALHVAAARQDAKEAWFDSELKAKQVEASAEKLADGQTVLYCLGSAGVIIGFTVYTLGVVLGMQRRERP